MADTSSGEDEKMESPPPPPQPPEANVEKKLQLLNYMKENVVIKLLELLDLDVHDYDQVYDYFFWNRVQIRSENFRENFFNYEIRDVLITAESKYYNPKDVFSVPFLMHFVKKEETEFYETHKKELQLLEMRWNTVFEKDMDLPDLDEALRGFEKILIPIQAEVSVKKAKKLKAKKQRTGAKFKNLQGEKFTGTETSEEETLELQEGDSIEPLPSEEFEKHDPLQNDWYLKDLLFKVDRILKSFLPEKCRTDEGLQNYLERNYNQLFDKQIQPFFKHLLEKKITTNEKLLKRFSSLSLEEEKKQPHRQDTTASRIATQQRTPPKPQKTYIGSGVISLIIEKSLHKKNEEHKIKQWESLKEIQYQLNELYGTWKEIPEKTYNDFNEKLKQIKMVESFSKEKHEFFLEKLDETFMIRSNGKVAEIPFEFFEWMRLKIHDRKFVADFIKHWYKMVLDRIPIPTVRFSENFGKFQVLCSICDVREKVGKWKNDLKKLREQLKSYDKKVLETPPVNVLWGKSLVDMRSFGGKYNSVLKNLSADEKLCFNFPRIEHLVQRSQREKEAVRSKMFLSQEWKRRREISMVLNEVFKSFLPKTCKTFEDLYRFMEKRGSTKFSQDSKDSVQLFFEDLRKKRHINEEKISSGNLSIIIENIAEDFEDFNWRHWGQFQKMRNDLFSMFSANIDIASYKKIMTDLRMIYERNGTNKWADLWDKIDQRQRNESDSKVFESMHETMMLPNKSGRFSDISKDFYCWVKSIGNLYDFEEARLLLGNIDIPFSTFIKSRDYDQFRVLCTVFSLSTRSMGKEIEIQSRELRETLFGTDMKFGDQIYRYVADRPFVYQEYNWFYERIVNKACMMSDSSSKYFHTWKRISHQAASRLFCSTGGIDSEYETLQRNRCLAEVFRKVWNNSTKTKLERVIFVAHGCITSDIVDMPFSDKHIKHVRLFPPWGCLLNGSAVPGILNGTAENPSKMKVVSKGKDGSPVREKVYWSGHGLVKFKKVPTFNILKPDTPAFDVRLSALNLDADKYFLNKMALFMEEKASENTVVVPYFSSPDMYQQAPVLNLELLADIIGIMTGNKELSLDVLCCLGTKKRKDEKPFPVVTNYPKYLRPKNYCSVKLPDGNGKIIMIGETHDVKKESRIKTYDDALTVLLNKLDPDPSLAREILELIYTEYTK